jgi:PAS domain S-box-containing protein
VGNGCGDRVVAGRKAGWGLDLPLVSGKGEMDTEWIWDRLDPVEKHIAELLLEGNSNKVIAAEIPLSRARVQERVKRITMKAGAVSTREALVLLAQERETSSLLHILDQASDCVVILQDKVFKFANKALSNLLGYTAEELVGIPFASLAATDGVAHEQTRRYEQRLEGEPFPGRYTTRALCKTGESIQVVVASGGMVRFKGRPAMMAIISDSQQGGSQ